MLIRPAMPFERLATADIVRGEQASQHAAVPRRLLRRNLIRHRLQSPAGPWPQNKRTRTLCQRAEPHALGIKHFDLADISVRVGVELNPRFVGRVTGSSCAALFRDVDHTGRAADTERGDGRRNFHVAGFGDKARDKGGRPGHNIEGGCVGGAALRIDEFVDNDPRVLRKAERRLVVKCDTERGVGGRRKCIVLEDGVIDAQRNGCRRLGAASRSHCLAAWQPDRFDWPRPDPAAPDLAHALVATKATARPMRRRQAS